MTTTFSTGSYFHSDQDFNQLYSPAIQQLATRHWTPLSVARRAANFLAASPGVQILDIGSGAGKFCLAAAQHRPHAHFTGIEQRAHLVQEALAARSKLRLTNVSFIHGNFTQLDLRHFDHVYFYNSFYENLSDTDKIDQAIDYSVDLYNYYNRYLFRQLDSMPAGTRLVTYHSLEDEVPPGFHTVWSDRDQLLKCQIKI